jgi:potassium efflux system protein
VKGVLLQVARDNAKVLADPPPQALLLAFEEDALKFELRVYVEFGVGLGTRDELQMALVRSFRRAGIEFAIPRLSIQVPNKPDQSDIANDTEAPS